MTTTTPSSSPIAFNITTQATLKLTNANYTAWRFQFQTLLTGYDLLGYINGAHPCPSATLTTDGATSPNPAYALWIRQDQLILSAIIGAISPSLIPFIASATSSRDAWSILANTYGKPSRGRIMSLKNRLRNPIKGTKSITDFMQEIKGVVDELALLGVTTDPEDLVLTVLNGLDDSYKELAHAIQASANKYLENGKVSSGVPVVLDHMFFLLGLGQGSIHLNDTSKLVSSVATILRLWNDLGSAKDEHEDGKDGPYYIECYRKEHLGLPLEQAHEHIVDMIADEWKTLNEECFRLNQPEASSFKRASLNVARMVSLMYSYDDNQQLPVLEEYVEFMLFNETT